ncbi:MULTISPECIES: N-6 DNA methylase [Burkholderia]|uniref:N-6 DNA methylase n=1 Tax=Burkholderia TaxID=32008 RepID=UPI00016B13AE|nr:MULTISPECIES: N-6 DNA methylase [Burkholderia]ANW51324.1 DNA methyltransferase [Burkholderia pseudomallei]ANW57319.1 DNA methyltransferase [Burkholderia pseudomallei]APF93544.1 DNA methyltransferase [Burkholderia pseudomallei]APF99585.1 DNA methyltransferase [Burkholderia pseudomallei]ARK54155.1 DNA methyltransferase [Burkholderia pseudomallei]
MSARNTVKSIQDIMRQDVGVDGDAQRLSQLCWMFFLKIIDDQDQQLEVMQDGYRSPIPKALQWRTWAADPEGITGDALIAFINTELFPQLKELPVTGKNANRSRVVRGVFEDAYNYMKSGQLMRQVVNKISGVDFNDLAERKHFGDIYEQLLNDLQSAGNAGEYYTPRAVTAFMVDRIDPKPGEILFDPSVGTGGFLTCSIRHMRDRYVRTVEDEQALQAGLRAVEKKQLPHMLCVTNMLLHGIEDPSFVRHDNTLARPYISYGQADRVDIILTNPPFGGKEEDGIESNFPAHLRTKETADLFLALFIRLLKPGGRAGIVLPDGSLFGEGVKTRLKAQLLEECNLHTIVRLPNSVFKPYASIGTNLLFFDKGEPTKDVWFYEHRVPEGQKAYSMTRPIRLEHLQDCVEWWGGAARKGRQETEQAWKVSLADIKARRYNLDFKNPHGAFDDHGDPTELLAKLEQSERQTINLRDQLKSILAEALLR